MEPSQTRDQTCVPCIGRQTHPLCQQGSLLGDYFLLHLFAHIFCPKNRQEAEVQGDQGSLRVREAEIGLEPGPSWIQSLFCQWHQVLIPVTPGLSTQVVGREAGEHWECNVLTSWGICISEEFSDKSNASFMTPPWSWWRPRGLAGGGCWNIPPPRDAECDPWVLWSSLTLAQVWTVCPEPGPQNWVHLPQGWPWRLAPGWPLRGKLGSVDLVLCWLILIRSPHLEKLWNFLGTSINSRSLASPWEGLSVLPGCDWPGPSISEGMVAKITLCGGHRGPRIQDKQIVLKHSFCGPRSQIPAEWAETILGSRENRHDDKPHSYQSRFSINA